jgi:hypothetical protein
VSEEQKTSTEEIICPLASRLTACLPLLRLTIVRVRGEAVRDGQFGMFAAVAIVLRRVTADALAINTSYLAVMQRRKKSERANGLGAGSLVLFL